MKLSKTQATRKDPAMNTEKTPIIRITKQNKTITIHEESPQEDIVAYVGFIIKDVILSLGTDERLGSWDFHKEVHSEIADLVKQLRTYHLQILLHAALAELVDTRAATILNEVSGIQS